MGCWGAEMQELAVADSGAAKVAVAKVGAPMVAEAMGAVEMVGALTVAAALEVG